MKIEIVKLPGDTIAVTKDLRDIDSAGEISHVLVELEILKQQLLMLWIRFKEKDQS